MPTAVQESQGTRRAFEVSDSTSAAPTPREAFEWNGKRLSVFCDPDGSLVMEGQLLKDGEPVDPPQEGSPISVVHQLEANQWLLTASGKHVRNPSGLAARLDSDGNIRWEPTPTQAVDGPITVPVTTTPISAPPGSTTTNRLLTQRLATVASANQTLLGALIQRFGDATAIANPFNENIYRLAAGLVFGQFTRNKLNVDIDGNTDIPVLSDDPNPILKKLTTPAQRRAVQKQDPDSQTQTSISNMNPMKNRYGVVPLGEWHQRNGINDGDTALIMLNGVAVPIVFADMGPTDVKYHLFGEVSVATAMDLGAASITQNPDGSFRFHNTAVNGQADILIFAGSKSEFGDLRNPAAVCKYVLDRFTAAGGNWEAAANAEQLRQLMAA
jgi:hypothetical protein